MEKNEQETIPSVQTDLQAELESENHDLSFSQSSQSSPISNEKIESAT
jgi:hypothetical protein